MGRHASGRLPPGRGNGDAGAMPDSPDAPPPPPPPPAPPQVGRLASPRTISLIVASAMFMEQLDGTVLATALPTMARSFNADPLHMNVALTSYLLTLAMFIPASGRLADRFGSRTVFRGAIALFTLGSIACAQAPEPGLPGAGAHAARHRRRADVPGRAAGAAARGVQGRAGARHGLADDPGDHRPDPRPAGRRLHRHLSVMALDLLHQRADRPARHRAVHPVTSRRCASRRRSRSTCSGWRCPAPRWPACCSASRWSPAASAPRSASA